MAYSGRNSVIDEIKSRCNIVDVIGSVVSLRKTGANYVGLCPFHNEKTPSFVVSESKQVYTCYGCHEWGDVITFVEKYYNLSFIEAIEKLAAQCGVSLDDGFGRSEKKDIYYERFGIRKSIFGAFDIIHFPWMYLSPGVNQFAFVMDDENYDNVTITIEHSGAYGGV